MGNLNSTVERLNKLQPSQIVKDEQVKARFIEIHETLWGNGAAAYEREANYFNHWILDNAKVAGQVTHLSIFSAFLDLAICGLSIEGGTQALCYLQPRNYQTGTDPNGKKNYETRLTLTISGYGELVLRQRCGQIKYADNPVIVYEGDEFSFNDRNGVKTINYERKMPRQQGAAIIACYIRIVRNDGSIDYAAMFPEDWERLAGYSGKQNRTFNQNTKQWEFKANELYTSNNGQIDTGFLIAKCIKHAFKTYPKVRIGKATALQTEQQEPEQPFDFDNAYGLDEQGQQPEPELFAEPANPSAGVVIQPQEDDDTF